MKVNFVIAALLGLVTYDNVVLAKHHHHHHHHHP